tara:strand:+ start:691 stop:795 length:105 start_codon:yes stop_codon:yes gene_type:complete
LKVCPLASKAANNEAPCEMAIWVISQGALDLGYQ